MLQLIRCCSITNSTSLDQTAAVSESAAGVRLETPPRPLLWIITTGGGAHLPGLNPDLSGGELLCLLLASPRNPTGEGEEILPNKEFYLVLAAQFESVKLRDSKIRITTFTIKALGNSQKFWQTFYEV